MPLEPSAAGNLGLPLPPSSKDKLRRVNLQIAAENPMQGDMGNQIAPPVLLEVKARRAFALVRRE